MIEVRVCRGGAVYDPPRCELDDASLKWGNSISDSVLCTIESAQERGRVGIDESYINRLKTDILLHSQEFTQPGSLISVTDGINSDNGILQSILIEYARTLDSIVSKSNLSTEMLV